MVMINMASKTCGTFERQIRILRQFNENQRQFTRVLNRRAAADDSGAGADKLVERLAPNQRKKLRYW